MMLRWDWDTFNFWSKIAFAFTGLELISAMSGEIRDPRKTLPRAALTAAAPIAGMYMVGTFSVLSLVPAGDLEPKSGVVHALTLAATARKIRVFAELAALLVTVLDAGAGR